MRSALIFCPNHSAILPTLELVSTNPTRRILVVVSRPIIRRILQKAALPTTTRLLFLPHVNATVASFSPRAILNHKRIYRLIYDRHFSDFEGLDVFFFNHLFWDFGLKLIQDLSRRNRIYFWNIFKLTHLVDRVPIAEFLLHLLFGLKDIAVFHNLNQLCPAITDRFITANKIKQVIPKPDFRITSVYRQNLTPNIKNIKVMILPSGDHAVPEVDKVNFQNRYKYLVRILLKRYRPEQILVKPHPGITEDVPSLAPFINPKLNDIPAELLLSSDLQILLSTKATTLGFQRPYLMKLSRISLLYYFYPPSPQREIFESMLKAMPTDIAFPTSHVRLSRLILTK